MNYKSYLSKTTIKVINLRKLYSSFNYANGKLESHKFTVVEICQSYIIKHDIIHSTNS